MNNFFVVMPILMVHVDWYRILRNEKWSGTGKLFGFFEYRGYPASAKIPEYAIDAAIAMRLWKETEQLTGIVFNPMQAIV